MPWDLISQPLQGSREVGQDKAGPDIPIYSCDPLDPRPPPAPAVLAALASPTEQPEIIVLGTPLPVAICLSSSPGRFSEKVAGAQRHQCFGLCC